MKFLQSAVSLLLASTAIAAPVLNEHERRATPRKRLALWEWTLTRDFQSYAGIRSTAKQLESSPVIAGAMNWEAWIPSEVKLTHEPMARVMDSMKNSETWSTLKASVNAAKAGGVAAPVVHFLNEPERQGVTPRDAAKIWKSHFVNLRKKFGTKIVGPAVASDSAGSKWLDEFMGYLDSSQKPDYIGVHFYTSQSASGKSEVKSAQDYIAGQSFRYGGIPVVVSEIACTNRNYADVEYFTKEMISWLDAQSWVYQYGFFGMSREPTDGFVSPAAQLMDKNGSLTKLGKIYALNQ